MTVKERERHKDDPESVIRKKIWPRVPVSRKMTFMPCALLFRPLFLSYHPQTFFLVLEYLFLVAEMLVNLFGTHAHLLLLGCW